jgi:hypothetical protein
VLPGSDDAQPPATLPSFSASRDGVRVCFTRSHTADSEPVALEDRSVRQPSAINDAGLSDPLDPVAAVNSYVLLPRAWGALPAFCMLLNGLARHLSQELCGHQQDAGRRMDGWSATTAGTHCRCGGATLAQLGSLASTSCALTGVVAVLVYIGGHCGVPALSLNHVACCRQWSCL